MTEAELNGHIDRVQECRDWIEHEHIMEGGDTSGRLGEFVESLRIVLTELSETAKLRDELVKIVKAQRRQLRATTMRRKMGGE
jgi:hypothetical protein